MEVFKAHLAIGFHGLGKKIEAKGFDVYTLDFPKGVGFQNYNNWSNLLKSYLMSGLLNINSIIFAHSITPVFICKFLIENQIKVKRLVFVYGFNNYLGINEEYYAVNKSMFFDNLRDVKKYCNDIICFYTDNDPYVKFETEKEFTDTIGAKQILTPNGSHLNSESGFSEFKELLEYM